MIGRLAILLNFIGLVLGYNYAKSFKSDQKTSYGTIGEGLEILEGNLNNFESYVSDSEGNIDDELDSSITIMDTLSTSLLNSEISDLERQLNVTNNQITQLENELTTITNCSGYGSCPGCSLNYECVWCTDSKICVSGDDSGPYNDDCVYYDYGYCSSTGCDVYTTCGVCIQDESCSWCANGNICSDDNSSCEPDYLYSLDGNQDCPSNYKDSNSDNYIDTSDTTETQDDIESQLQNLYNQRDELQDEIDDLNNDLDNITSASNNQSSRPTAYSPYNQLNGLGDTVDEMYQDEIDDDQDYQENLAETTSQDTISSVDAIVKSSNQQIMDALDQDYNQIEQELNALEATINSNTTEVSSDISSAQNSTSSSS
jgi:predicted  nucleic acid-binding Zn-ribbon protein